MHLLGHAGAGVDHLEPQGLPARAGPSRRGPARPDADANPAFGGEFHGVGDQVGKDLGQPQGIGADDLGQRPVELDIELQAALDGLGAPQRRHLVGGVFEVDVGHVDGQLAGLDLGQVQHVVDQAEQDLAAVQQDGDIVALRLIEVGALKQVRGGGHRVQRRADFVAEGGEEGGFAVVRRLGDPHLVLCEGVRVAQRLARAAGLPDPQHQVGEVQELRDQDHDRRRHAFRAMGQGAEDRQAQQEEVLGDHAADQHRPRRLGVHADVQQRTAQHQHGEDLAGRAAGPKIGGNADVDEGVEGRQADHGRLQLAAQFYARRQNTAMEQKSRGLGGQDRKEPRAWP